MVIARILIIDDDKMICEALADMISQMGHEAQYALRLKDGLDILAGRDVDVVFLDVRLPDGNGLSAVPDIRKLSPLSEVIIITGEGDPDGAELAIKNGVWDYIQKPLSLGKVMLPLRRIIEYQNTKKSRKPSMVLKREEIIGSSSQITRCLELVSQAATNDASVLISGETGTGKELIARAIHYNSDRSDNPFIIVDGAALPETLVESVLFGHEKGAFTGADKAQVGLIKQADKGTLFIDEVGELPKNIQKAFLRVLQERRFRTIGGKQEIGSDFRLITATNRNLDQMVHTNKFRNDLLFRIRSILIDVPPLRDRREDIKEIALFYMAKLCSRYGIGTKGFSPEYIDAMTTYNWPGNVRELVNALDNSLAKAHDEHTLFPIHLPSQIRIQLVRASVDPHSARPTFSHRDLDSRKTLPKLREMLDKTEKEYLKDLLLLTDWDVKEACRISGLSRSRFYDRLNKHALTRHP